MPTAEEVLERLKLSLGCKTDADLGRVLDTAPTTISSWRTRDSIPYEDIARLAADGRFDMEDIIFGRSVGDKGGEKPALDKDILALALKVAIWAARKGSDISPSDTDGLADAVLNTYLSWVNTIDFAVNVEGHDRGDVVRKLIGGMKAEMIEKA